jgi:serine protease Do
MFDPLRAKSRVLIYTTVAFTLGLGGATLLGWDSLPALPAITEAPQISDDAVRPAVELSEAFTNIAEAVTPAVVRIETERPRTGGGQQQPLIPEEFRRFFDFPSPDPRQDAPPRTAGGSGFVVSPDGYILTNDHVVSGATRIRVFLPDRREYIAELVGTDPTTDVAVIKINERNLATLSLGSSSEVRVGEWVLAVGNPGFGGGSRVLNHTVTAGIISAIGRPLQLIQGELSRQEAWQEISSFAIEDFIQTDAVINPGNSGGPLVNVRGQVVGINTAIASVTGYYQGYGFAIPVDLAKRIMEDLIQYGEVRRAYLGVEMQEVEPVDAELYGLPRPMGALVQSVPEGGPAAQAGFRQEDVIVAIDGVPVERPGQLQLLIAQRRPGDRVRVRFYRDGQPQEVSVRLGQADLAPRTRQASRSETRADARIGIEVGSLDEATAERLGYGTAGGVVIRQVTPAGPAARRNVTPDQRILEINRTPVETVEDVNRILEAAQPGDVVSLRLERPAAQGGGTWVANLRVPQ